MAKRGGTNLIIRHFVLRNLVLFNQLGWSFPQTPRWYGGPHAIVLVVVSVVFVRGGIVLVLCVAVVVAGIPVNPKAGRADVDKAHGDVLEFLCHAVASQPPPQRREGRVHSRWWRRLRRPRCFVIPLIITVIIAVLNIPPPIRPATLLKLPRQAVYDAMSSVLDVSVQELVTDAPRLRESVCAS